MIGEEEGNPEKAFDEFVLGINKINNPELKPVENALERVKPYQVLF